MDSCWIWTGKLAKGYGYINVDGKSVRAHRLSWEIHNGAIPDGMMVCHNCPGGDNPSCVNPGHLFLGTGEDNVADMYAKGRAYTGNRHRLSLDEVIRMRALRTEGATWRELAEAFGVSDNAVRNVLQFRTWKNV